MNFINRAIKNVSRSLTKSILLTLTFFLIGNLVIVGLGVSQASKSAKTLTRQKMRAVVNYEINYNEVYQYMDTIEDEDEYNNFKFPRITIEDVNEILMDERVKTANALSNNQFYVAEGGIDYVHLNNQQEENMAEQMQNCEQNNWCYEEPNFFVKANYFPDMIEFADGQYYIVDGRFYTQEEIDNDAYVVLISEQLAEQNGVRVGDRITVNTFSSTDYNQEEIDLSDVDPSMDLEVIGIYGGVKSITPDAQNFDWASPYENPVNMLLMPATTIENKMASFYEKIYAHYQELYPEEDWSYERESYISDVVLLLNDPLEVDAFVEDYTPNLRQFMKLNANNEEFNKLSKPLDTLSLYANFIVWLVVINAIVIITLVTALTLKTREYEIGVLLSIGATKLKVIAQFFVELALIAILGFTLSVGTGSLIAGKVGETVLEYQIQSSDVNEGEDDYYWDYDSIWDSDYSTEISLEDLTSEYSVQVSLPIIAEIYVMGLGIVLLAVIIPSFMIMRYNPKKILMNQG
ncbi:MAG: FtsX-like permease family protein [Erysipelotrichaceae bacterium]|nr:FtsX-like permease family protein [Erysipelotrichaceae bacterium]